jgi:isoleucyl-tRNA synthetase
MEVFMPFKDVPNKVDFPAQERDFLEFWNQSGAFQKLYDLHKDDPIWSFIDGPITANNPMGVHHGWGRTYKDLINRYWTMKGHKLRYQQGFDCQGLWVEVEVEKEMGFHSKKDIEDYGLEQFVRKCKARVLRYAAVQTEQSVRLGYWMDWNDPAQLRWLADLIETEPMKVVTVQGPDGPLTDSVEMIVGRLGLPELGGSYFTFSNENNYMIWQMLKKCQQKGWLYRGADVMPWCRDRHRRLRRADPPIGNLALSPARARERILAGVDDHALDADQQCGRGRRSGSDLRQGAPGG